MTLSLLSDAELIANFQDLIIEEREKLVLQLEHLIELDRRKLFLHYPSLRSYLVEEHGMEEWQAERRIRAARLLKRFPELKFKLESGKLNLTLLEIGMGCAHREGLSDPELMEILEAISGMSCRAARREIASRFPESLELPRDRIRPLNAEYSEVTFVASQGLLDKLEEIRGLLAHSHPNMRMGELIDVIATEYRTRNHPEEKARRAQEREVKKKRSEVVETPAPARVEARKERQKEQRTASQAMVHELVRDEGYLCTYVDPISGKRCMSRYGLEVDHVHAWSKGGKTEPINLRFLCKNHHRRVSFLEFGSYGSSQSREVSQFSLQGPQTSDPAHPNLPQSSS
jgi:5-methylcytosine-specific restriction endonuclease McrA